MASKQEKPSRLTAAQVRDWLAFEEPARVRIAKALRQMVLRAAPLAAEGMRFGCVCYYREGKHRGAIGGNVCMIEAKGQRLRLSFIQGAFVDDPGGLLRGSGKAKRFVPIASLDEARDPRLVALVRAAARRAFEAD